MNKNQTFLRIITSLLSSSISLIISSKISKKAFLLNSNLKSILFIDGIIWRSLKENLVYFISWCSRLPSLFLDESSLVTNSIVSPRSPLHRKFFKCKCLIVLRIFIALLLPSEFVLASVSLSFLPTFFIRKILSPLLFLLSVHSISLVSRYLLHHLWVCLVFKLIGWGRVPNFVIILWI